MVLRVSAKQTAGSWLEGTQPILLDIGPDARMLDRLGQQIDRAAEPEEAFHGVADERWMKARMTGLGVTGLAVRVWVRRFGT
jgi:hypothetical protein